MRIDTKYLNQTGEGKFYYLASPYTSPITEERTVRAYNAMMAAGWLISQGVYVFSPIWHCHAPSMEFSLPKDHHFWLRFDESFIIPSAGIIVCMLPGWELSKGVAHEIDYGRKIGKDIYYFDPEKKEIHDR